MSTTGVGKKREQEVARLLREPHGWEVERVSGSGGFSGTRSADIVVLPESIPSDMRIDDYLADSEASQQDIICGEVKYKSEANGFKTMYYKHLMGAGLKTNSVNHWRGGDGKYVSGGANAIVNEIHRREMPILEYVVPESPPTAVCEVLEGERDKTAPDFAAFRGSKRGWPLDWIFVWKHGALT